MPLRKLSLCINVVVFLLAIVFAFSPLQAQTDSSDASLAKAMKYHKVLQARPNSGYLFDRFYNTWLDSSSLDDLEAFLTKKVAEKSATNDQLLLAFFYTKQGDDIRALEQFRLALKNDPTNAPALYEKAVVEARTLDFETALKDLDSALQAKTKPEEAIKIAQLKGKLLVRNRQNAEAIKVWEALVKANPTNDGVIEDVIELQISEGLYDEADSLSDKLIAITKDPYQKVMRRLRKGDIFQRAGKRKKALDVYGQTLGQVGMDTWLEREILGQIEQLFRREDDLIGLKDHYASLIKAESKRMAIRKAHSKVLFEIGMADEAIKSFEEIIKLTPGNRANRVAFVELLSRAEKLDLAVKQTESLIEQYPKDAELQIKLAQLNFKNGNKEKVEAAINNFITVSECTEYAYLRAARLLEKYDNVTKAGEIYEKAVATFPESESAEETHASFLHKNEKKEEAIAIWKKLAAGGDRSQLVRIARIVGSRQEHAAAFEMLQSRFEDFKRDSIYLGQLCTEAIALKKFEDAVPWVQDRVKFAKKAGDLDTCMGQAIQVISSSEKSAAIIKELSENKNRTVSTTCLLAELLERDLQNEKADELLKTTLSTFASGENSRESVQMLSRQQVRLFMNRQEWNAAAEASKKMIGLPGGRNSVNIRQLVDLYIRAGQFDSALTWVGEWKQTSPGSLLPWLNESQIHERQGDYKKSISVLRMATQKFPNDADLFAQLGQRYLRNGQYKDAERIYWRQYEESKNLSDKLRWSERLADLSGTTGETEELVAKFEERKRNNPKSIEPLLAIAQVHRIADNYEERRMALLEATRIQKDSLPLMMEIARLEESEGEWEKAIETLEEAAKLDKTTRAREKIARLYIQYGESEEGFARMLEIAGGENSTARDVESIASAIIDTEDWEQTREFLLPQLTRFNNDYRLKFMLAVTNERLDLVADAQEGFFELMGPQEEIKGLKKNANGMGVYFGGQMQMVKVVLPADASDLYEVMMQKQYSQAGYRSANEIELPETVQECKRYALTQLTGLYEALNESEQGILRNRVKQFGYNSDLLFSDALAVGEDGDSEGLIDANPENEVALALGIFNLVGQPSDDPKYGLKGFETFKDSYPELAFMGAIQAAVADPKHKPVLDQAIELVKDTEKPNVILVSAIARFITNPSGELEDTSLSKESISELNGLLKKWYPSLQSDPSMSPWMFNYVAQALKANDSLDSYIEFLDEEIDRASKKQAPSMGGMFGRYRARESLVQLPTFPPAKLIKFPESVYEILNLSQEEQGYSPFSSSGEPEDIGKYAASVGKAKNPILKTLLQVKIAAEDDEELAKPIEQQNSAAKQSLEALLKSQKPNIDAHYLAACLASSEERWADAADYFERMRNLPMGREMRRKVDSHLVALATNGLGGDFEKGDNEAIVNSAKSAALRLRRIRLAPEERQQLVGVFEILGLKEEAEKMETKMAQGRGNPLSSMFGAMMGTPAAAAPVERVRQLVDSGKSDAAARLLAQEFKGLASQDLTMGTMFQNEYELREFKDKLVSLELNDQFFKAIDPGEATTGTKVSAFAYGHEMFGDKEKAKDIYRMTLAKNEKQDGVRIRLMILEIPSDPNAFTKHYSKLQKRNRLAAGTNLTRLFYSDQLKFEEKMSLAKQIIPLLDSDETKKSDLAWVEGCLGMIAQQMEIDDSSYLGSVYAKKEDKAEPSEEELKKESKREKKAREAIAAAEATRTAIHNELARKLIDVPEFAGSGFTALLAATEAAGKPVGPEFVELARKAMKPPEKSGRNSASQPGGSWGMYRYGDDEEDVKKRSPSDFLARHFGLAEEQAQSDAAIEEIANQLEQWKKEAEATSFRDTYGLYRAAPEQFAKTATEFVEKSKKARRRNVPDPQAAAMAKAVEVWIDRSAPADISQLVMQHQKESTKKPDPYGSDGASYLGPYVAKIATANGTPAAAKFVAEFREAILGTEEEQAALVAMVSDEKKRRRVTGKQRAAYQAYIVLIRSLLEEKDTMFLAFEEASTMKLGDQLGSVSYQFRNLLAGQGADKPEEFMEWLGKSKVLDELETFDPYFLGGQSDEPTFWGEAITSLANYTDDETKLVKYLKKKDKLKFGEKLLLLAFDGAGIHQSEKVYDLFGTEIEKLKSFPEEKQAKLAQFVNQINNSRNYYGNRRAGEMTPDGELAKALFRTHLSSSATADVQKILDAKRISDLGMADHQVAEWTGNVVGLMDKSDSDKVVSVVLKAMKLIGSSQSRSPFEDNSMQGRLLESAFATVDFDSVKTILALIANENAKGFTITDELSESMASFVASEVAAADEKPTKSNPKLFTKAIDSFHRKMGQQLNDRDVSCLISSYERVLAGTEYLDFEHLEKWAEMESGGKYPKLANAWQIAILSSKYRAELIEKRKESDSSKGGESNPPAKLERLSALAEYQSELVTMINNKELTTGWKLPIAKSLLNDPTLSAEGVWACSNLIGQSLKEKYTVSDTDVRRVFEAMLDCESDASFKENASAFGKSWSAAKLRNINGRSRYGYYGGYGDEWMEIAAAIKLFTKTDERAVVNKIIRVYGDRIKDRRLIATLIGNGYHSHARKLTATTWAEKDQSFDRERSSVSYTKELQAEIPAYVKLFPNDGSKLLAEAYIAELKDSKVKEDVPDVPRDERLLKLAERFGGVTFTSKREREMALVLLSKSKLTAKHIAAPIEEIASKLKLEQLWTENDVFTDKVEMVIAHLGIQVQLGNFEPLEKFYEELNKVEVDDDSWRFDNLTRQISTGVSARLADAFESSSTEQFDQLASLVAELNKPGSKYSVGQEMNVLFHVMAGKTDQLIKDFGKTKAQWKELEDDDSVSSIDGDEIWPTLVKYLKARNEFDDEARRLKLVKEIWQAGAQLNFVYGSGHFQDGVQESCSGCREGKFGLDAIKEAKLLTGAQIAEHGPAMAEFDSVDGEIWRQVGKELWAVEKFEKAADAFKEALDATKEDMKQAKQNRKVEYANALVKIKRDGEAKKLLADVESGLLLGENVETYGKLKAQLDEK